MKRLFLALPLQKEEFPRLDLYLESYKKDPHFQKAKWVEPENFHITLLFLGNVSELYLPELRQLVRGLSAKIAPFTLHFDQIQFFPRKFPHMIWASFHRSLEFEELTGELKKYLEVYIQNQEKKEQIPHATLARLKAPLDPRKFSFRPYRMPDLLVKECQLFESTLTPDGPHYTLIETFPYAV